jgi:DNA primase catalytic core
MGTVAADVLLLLLMLLMHVGDALAFALEGGGKAGGGTSYQRLSQETLERLRGGVPLSNVVSRTVELSPSGRGMVGRCPFHDDRTPSFSVDDSRGLYYCFGCGAGGDIIKFLMETEGLTFPEAVSMLAEETGVAVETTTTTTATAVLERQARDRLSLVLEMAAQFYVRCLAELPAAGAARRHLMRRALSSDIVTEFQIGYSPSDESSPLVKHLHNEGFESSLLMQAGLVSQSASGGYRDRFQGRLVIPIRDHRGGVIAFGARILEDDSTSPSPKYLNSPETDLFKKSRCVFGLDLARPFIRAADCGILVEGYFDVITLHNAGVRNVVGSMGTAVSVDQLELIARNTRSKRVVLCLDADDAGVGAVERMCRDAAGSGMAALTEAGADVRVAALPTDCGCKDPADFITLRGGGEFQVEVVDAAIPWTEWYGRVVLSQHNWANDSGAFRACIDALTLFLSDFPIPAERTMHAYKYAEVLSQGNAGLRAQLEADIMSLTLAKERRKHALRRRVEGVDGAAGQSVGQLASGGVQVKVLPPPQPTKAPLSASLDLDLATVDSQTLSDSSRVRAEGSLFADEAASGMKSAGMRWGQKQVRRGQVRVRGPGGKQVRRDAAPWMPAIVKEAQQPAYSSLLRSAERSLLSLMLRDVVRRYAIAEAVRRNDVALSSPSRQWLFDAIADRKEPMSELLPDLAASSPEPGVAEQLQELAGIGTEQTGGSGASQSMINVSIQELLLVLFRARAVAVASLLVSNLSRAPPGSPDRQRMTAELAQAKAAVVELDNCRARLAIRIGEMCEDKDKLEREWLGAGSEPEEEEEFSFMPDNYGEEAFKLDQLLERRKCCPNRTLRPWEENPHAIRYGDDPANVIYQEYERLVGVRAEWDERVPGNSKLAPQSSAAPDPFSATILAARRAVSKIPLTPHAASSASDCNDDEDGDEIVIPEMDAALRQQDQRGAARRLPGSRPRHFIMAHLSSGLGRGEGYFGERDLEEVDVGARLNEPVGDSELDDDDEQPSS